MIKGLKEADSIVLHNFAKISNIPRCSGEEHLVSKYLYNWAKEREIEVYQDRIGNIILKKQSSTNYEEHEPVLLQGHMDMVCEMKKGVSFDFMCDPIQAEIENGYVIAKNTTLGADNGIALAMIMSIFEDKTLIHPPLEALITVDEERGMTGAIHLEPKYISARKLINLDSEEEGVCCVGCAGGKRETVTIKKEEKEISGVKFFQISLEGLKGGHSGMDIHLGRANGNVILARILFEIRKELKIHLSSFTGGSKSNAIPRDSQAVVAVDPMDEKKLLQSLKDWEEIISKEYRFTDPDLRVIFYESESARCVVDRDMERLLSYILTAPNGVVSMSKTIPGQVESSTNLGVVEETENEWIITSQVRSSLDSKIQEISMKNYIASRLVDGGYEHSDPYPAWEYEPKSELREIASSVWKEFSGQELIIETIHAGLECGLLQDVLGKMDMISIGPSMEGVHAPGEKVSIESTEKVYKYLLELLKRL